MKLIDGDAAEKILLEEYERQVRVCNEDIKVGAMVMAECACHRAQGLRKALELIKGMPAAN